MLNGGKKMGSVKLSDSNKEKCDVLKSIGITVENYIIQKENRSFVKYVVSIKDMPDADKFIETTFNSINDILMAFSDRLTNYKILAA